MPALDYEAEFAALFGPSYQGFLFWKARVGLYAILRALDLKPDDEVIVPAYTCVVVPHAIIHAGAKPAFADIVPGEYNLDPASVEKTITRRTRVLIVQHTYGIPADVASLQFIAKKHGLILLEDCAHVLLGAKHDDQLLGSFGAAAFFSSQWSKPYTTGLGGAVITRDPDLALRLSNVRAVFSPPGFVAELKLRSQYWLYNRLFRSNLYWFAQSSLNTLAKVGLFVGSSNRRESNGRKPADLCWQMSEFQQKVGLGQLQKLVNNSLHRRGLAQFYSNALRKADWPVGSNYANQDLLRFPLRVQNKIQLLREARRKSVELGSWFDAPLHPLPLHEHHRMGYRLGSCPAAETAARTAVNLPLHDRVSPSEAARLMDFVIKKALRLELHKS